MKINLNKILNFKTIIILLFIAKKCVFQQFFWQTGKTEQKLPHFQQFNDENLNNIENSKQQVEELDIKKQNLKNRITEYHQNYSGNYVVVDKITNQSSIILYLKLQNNLKDYYIKKHNYYIKNLIFTFNALSYDQFEFLIDQNDELENRPPRFKNLDEYPFVKDPLKNERVPLNSTDYFIQYDEDPFNFIIYRNSTKEILFNSNIGKFIFSNLYIEINSQIANKHIFGMSERFSENFRLKNGIYTLFNRDRPSEIEDGKAPGKNTYSSWPVYLQRENSKKYHMNYLRNQNAKDFLLKDRFDGENKIIGKQIQYRIIGGILDFRFFLGQKNPEKCIRMFHKYTGGYMIPPFWSLGYHQCRWGYKNIYQLQNVIDKHKENKLPIDGIWSDIDYMVDYENFVVNTINFPLEKLQKIAEDYHYIPIVDAGIKIKSYYTNLNQYQLEKIQKQEEFKNYNIQQIKNYFKQISPIQQLLNSKAYIQKKEDGQPLTGKVWPGPVIYTDFFHPNSTDYWIKSLEFLYQQVKFSGIWLDMNEVSCFCDGQCPNSQYISKNNEILEDYSDQNYLPYQPSGESLEKLTISLNSTHFGGLKEYDVHNYYGIAQGAATAEFFRQKLKQQPFIISRSTGVGSSVNTFHWTGDSVSMYEWMKISIIGIFTSNMFGMPMNGADICGFAENTDQKLCARWLQLSTFYPFMRNHNSHDKISQEIYALGENVLKSGKIALQFRYQFLKQYFTLFIENGGIGSIYRPLFFEFYDDEVVINEDFIINSQIMIGDILMQVPILEQKKSYRKLYLPQNTEWYYFNTVYQQENNGLEINLYKGGQYYKIKNNQRYDLTPIFILAGKSIFMNDFNNFNSEKNVVLQSKDLNNEFVIYAAMKNIDQYQNFEKQKIKQFENFEKYKDYEYISQGRISSLSEIQYQDESLEFYETIIKQCGIEGCFYYFTIFMDQQNNILVQIDYVGQKKQTYNGIIQINKIKIMIKNQENAHLIIIDCKIKIENGKNQVIQFSNNNIIHQEL